MKHLRFLLDENVDAAVGAMLAQRGHAVSTVQQLGLAGVTDDEVSIAADDRRCVLVTHDREFSQRRGRYLFGRHVWLRCDELDAAQLLDDWLEEVVAICARPKPVLITLRVSIGMTVNRGR